MSDDFSAPGSKPHWTPEQDEIVKRMWADHPPGEIAKRCKPRRTAAAVTTRATVLGLPRKLPRGIFRPLYDFAMPDAAPEGYVSIAPGHIISHESYRLLREAGYRPYRGGAGHAA